MSDLFGFQAGRHIADQENRADALASMSMQKDAVQIVKDTQELAQNAAFTEAMKGMSMTAEKPQDVPDSLEKMGMLALDTGNPTKATQLINAASTVRNNQSLAERRAAQTNYQKLTTLSNLYNGVGNAQQWEQANAQYQLAYGEASPYAGTPYSPQIVEQVRNATFTAKDKASVALAQERTRAVKGQESETAARVELVRKQTELASARTEAIHKAGGGSKPVPSTYISAVKNELLTQMEDIGNVPGEAAAIALPLAEQAWAKVRDEGLTLSEAVKSVVAEAKESGDLGGFGATRKGMGESATKPLPMPRQKDGNPDAKLIKPNKYYLIESGPYAGKTVLSKPGGTFTIVEDDADEAGLEDEEEEDEE